MHIVNIVLSCSQQKWNKCLQGDTEQDHTFLIAQKIAELLKSYNSNVLLIPKLDASEDTTLRKIVELSNDFILQYGGKGYHIDIHTDAGAYSSGSSAFYVSEGGKLLSLRIQKELSNITPFGDGDINFNENLYVLRQTIAIATLIEIAFHDSLLESKWIHGNIDNIALAFVRGLEKATGIVKIEDDGFEDILDVLASYTYNGNPLLDKDYWFKNAVLGSKVNGEHARELIKRLFNFIKF